MTAKILVVDDDRLVINSIKRSMEFFGYDVKGFSNGDGLLQEIEKEMPDLILLDISLGKYNGIDLLGKIKKKYEDIPVVMITGDTQVQTIVTSIKAGAFDFIGKPLDLDQLELVISKALKHIRVNEELEALREDIIAKTLPPNLPCNSKAMKEIIELVKKVSAGENVSVLIQGETGVGKEVVAHLIHKQSSRAKGPFIAINCASLPRELIEGELFGSEKGAFTGALNRAKKGKFELADKGAILLDEISEIDQTTQAKLLRVLQEKAFYRVGGEKEIKVDVRVIATTNRDIESEISKGTFRKDLYYRLNVAKIIVPPLRERIEDIIPLTESFINECNKKFNKNFTSINNQAESILKSYSWPGNVRELKNLIEQIVLIEDGEELLPQFLNRLNSSIETVSDSNSNEFQLQIPAGGYPLDSIVKKAIVEALNRSNHNQTVAAKILGITRRQLTYKLKQFGLS